MKQLLSSSFKDRYRIKLTAYKENWVSLQSEWRILLAKIRRQFFRPKFPDLDGKLNLHLGCGDINHPQFVNVDGLPAPHIQGASHIGMSINTYKALWTEKGKNRWER